jgi:SAM-dependent methyltransferase
MTTPSWDSSYTGETPPPWDIGRPQPVFERLADEGLLSGRLLDAGCGTGEQVLLAASHGADATGIDISPHAIEKARAKAAARGLAARFDVGDALALSELGTSYDTIVDSGLFHVFADDDRGRYVASLASVLYPGGYCYLACFSDRQPGDGGPRRVREDELRTAFSDGWAVDSITPAEFDLVPGRFGSDLGVDADAGQHWTAHAWLAIFRRT